MNAHSQITKGRMTSKGQVLIPKAVRDAAGLVPGEAVCVALNDRGEAVVLPARAERGSETREQKKARILAAIDAVAGKYSTGQTTDEYMAEIRGPYDELP